jgi:molybdopterin/thiamine biosynthesis adenylyltransferase
MAAEAAVSGWSITFPESVWSRLQEHLFPGDGDEHGGVVAAGVSRGPGGLRLLARDVFLAKDGVDYVAGTLGYRRLEPHFVRDQMLACRDEELAYLAVHNHGGTGSVGFSGDDFGSHERGYPALLDIGRGVPVGALVLAKRAIAGDLWLPGGERQVLDHATIVGRRIMRYGPGAGRQPTPAAQRFDRQARLFGDTGQAILKDLRVGIIGCGGVGMLLVEYLSRLGVGHLVVIDPDRVDPTNLPRLPGARQGDTGWFADQRWPARLRAWGKGHARPKVDVARRLARDADPDIDVEAIFGDVLEAANAVRFTDVDYLFLAADTMQARLLFNAIVHQFLVPGAQLGSKVSLSATTGEVLDVHSVVRPVTPDEGCLWCNELIPPQRLAEEALTERDRLAQRYIDDPEVAAPSVITLNAVAAAHAATDFLFAVTGLVEPDAPGDYLRSRPRVRDVRWDRPRRDLDCTESGHQPGSRFARGDGVTLPVRVRRSRR